MLTRADTSEGERRIEQTSADCLLAYFTAFICQRHTSEQLLRMFSARKKKTKKKQTDMGWGLGQSHAYRNKSGKVIANVKE